MARRIRFKRSSPSLLRTNKTGSPYVTSRTIAMYTRDDIVRTYKKNPERITRIVAVRCPSYPKRGWALPNLGELDLYDRQHTKIQKTVCRYASGPEISGYREQRKKASRDRNLKTRIRRCRGGVFADEIVQMYTHIHIYVYVRRRMWIRMN